MMPIEVTQDAKRLSALHATSFDDAWSEVFFSAMLNQPGVTALGTAHGFILMRCVADEAEILTLAVDPAKRNAGLGGRLVEAGLVLALAQNVTRCFLEVAVDNLSAIAVYRKSGFKTCGTRKAYYTRGTRKVDAAVMEWRPELNQ